MLNKYTRHSRYLLAKSFMLKIRLKRIGRKNAPTFRVVLLDSQKGPQTGKVNEILGSYNPHTNEKVIKADRVKYWIDNGAQVSDTVHNILISEKIIEGKKINVLPHKSPVKSPVEEQETSQKAADDTQNDAEKGKSPTETAEEKSKISKEEAAEEGKEEGEEESSEGAEVAPAEDKSEGEGSDENEPKAEEDKTAEVESAPEEESKSEEESDDTPKEEKEA